MTTISTEKSEAIKIAVFGASREPKAWTWYAWPTKERRHAEDLGDMLGIAFGDKIEILTGACIGTPDLIASGARRHGTKVVGYSSKQTLQEHLDDPNYADPSHFDELKFIDPNKVVLNGFTERSMTMIKDAHALVCLGGRTGTLTEYLMAFDGSDKPMYALLGAGGAVDLISRWNIKKQRRNGLVYKTTSPLDLVSRIDHDFKISNFEESPDIQIIYTQSPYSWIQFLSDKFDKNKPTILVR